MAGTRARLKSCWSIVSNSQPSAATVSTNQWWLLSVLHHGPDPARAEDFTEFMTVDLMGPSWNGILPTRIFSPRQGISTGNAKRMETRVGAMRTGLEHPRLSSRIVARAVAAEVTRQKCFSRQNPPPYV